MSTVKQLSELLFLKCQHELPLAAGKISASKKDFSKKGIEQGLQSIYKEAREQRKIHRLGVIARARLAIALQQRLLHAGYAPELVRQIIFSILVHSFL